MKYLYILCAFSVPFTILSAQKHDYFWPSGYNTLGDTTNSIPIGGMSIDFNFSPPSIYKHNRSMNFHATVSSICDTLGDLIFYSNGEYFSDKFDNKIPNSDSINEPWSTGVGYVLQQGMIILPMPDTNNIYYVFHKSIRSNPNNAQTGLATGLRFTSFNATLNGGLGGIVEKGRTLIDTGLIDAGYLSACKHANGKDWWIITPNHISNTYNQILFSKSSVSLEKQSIGDTIPLYHDYSGWSGFSPDGTKYVFFNNETDIFLFDFNRCTGKLSNFKKIPIIDECDDWLSNCISGISISPNSQFLYISSLYHLYQFDLQVNDIEASMIKIADWDGVLDTLNFPAPFYFSQLGPDDKIYISCGTSSYFYHIINKPNQSGINCDFVQRGLQLPVIPGISLPYFPNFRLEASSQYYCDSLATNVFVPLISDKKKIEVKVFPNPASDFLILKSALTTVVNWELSNSNGKSVRSISFSGRKQIEIRNLPKGIYFWKTENSFGKLIIN